MRRTLDKYMTAPWQVRALLAHQPIYGRILEPCVGDGSIAKVLRDTDMTGARDVVTSDIDLTCRADYHGDAAFASIYETVGPVDASIYETVGPVDWVVTNPPYTMPTCTHIVEQAARHARVGVAMLLRISFREPTAKVHPRGPFLEAHPVSRVLTLSRYSFTQDGKTDSATCEWLIWLKEPSTQPPILSLYRADERY